MLPVRSGAIGRKIDESRVVKVAKGAIEEVLQGTQDTSQEMNAFDKLYDLFCNGVKRAAISRISGMGRHTARLHTELEKPISARSGDVITSEELQIEENQNKLTELMQGGRLKFGQIDSRAAVDHRAYLIYTDQSEKAPIGVALYKSAEIVPKDGGVQLFSIPNFESSEVIRQEDLNIIRASRRINYKGKEYQVRVHGLNEPIVIYPSSDSVGKVIQSKLSALWAVEQSGRSLDELERLEPLDGSLTLPSILPEPVTGQSRTTAQIDLLNEWAPVSRDAVDNLRALADLFHAKLELEKDALKEALEALNSHRVRMDDRRKVWLQTRSELHIFVNKQETMRQYINDVRQTYCRLYFLASKSVTSEMRSIFKARIKRFNRILKNYVASNTETTRVTFNQIKNTQEEFLRHFGVTQLLHCTNLVDPTPGMVKPWKIIEPPKDLEARGNLIDLLTRPGRSWIDVAEAMQTLESRQKILLDAFVLRHELTLKISEVFKSFKGENGEGLDPKTGKSFYTPETFSRIITLKGIRNQLMDSRKIFTLEALRDKDAIVAGHIMSIQNETAEIDGNEKRFRSSKKSSMHMPEKIVETGHYMDHMQWTILHEPKSLA